MNERVQGKIKTWKSDSGYGFATVSGGRDIFIHIRSLRNGFDQLKALEEGQEVEFEIVDGRKEGQVQGVDVVLLNGK